ncbi:MAG: ribbon-helix-helix protein, CopG family [Pyrinomonadaceae bacterium]|nr:ribbon-helix-helix protein, CopG family [Pyrinomonadaceae bacterium]
MEISVKLPDNLYQNVSHLAKAKKKSVAEVIKNAVRKAVAENSTAFEEQAEIIKQSIGYCSDHEVLELANLQLPADRRLSYLFEKNRESVLTVKEQAELAKAVEISRINDLRKAFGIIEAKKRGLIK